MMMDRTTVVEVLENLSFLATASNLVTYLMGSMGYSPSQSATAVTSFMGTAFLLALLGGFLSDAFLTTYTVYIASAFVELTVRASSYITYRLLLLPYRTVVYIHTPSSTSPLSILRACVLSCKCMCLLSIYVTLHVLLYIYICCPSSVINCHHVMGVWDWAWRQK
jgi:hypothetical protein